MPRYYCKWCGSSASSVSSLTSGSCSKNPVGRKHEPYEGEEKKFYFCKYCGTRGSSISSLTSGSCSKSPTKRHVPMR